MTRTLSPSGGNRMRSTEILSEPMDGPKNLADTWTTSRRSTSLTSHPSIKGTSTKAPSRWRATRRIVKLDQGKQEQIRTHYEHSRKSSTRTRQRPFDEALRAKFEGMSQNWRTCFSQLSPSSSSSQIGGSANIKTLNGVNTKTPNGNEEIKYGKFAGFHRSFACRNWRFPCKRQGKCRQNTSSHAHFSQSCRVAHVLSTLNLHTRMRVAQDVFFGTDGMEKARQYGKTGTTR